MLVFPYMAQMTDLPPSGSFLGLLSAELHDLKRTFEKRNIIVFAAEGAAVDAVRAEHSVESKLQIRRQLERLTNMINELLVFTRCSSRSVTMEPTEYQSFVEEFLQSIEPKASEKSVKII